ncbi:hypothetical protein GUITHDRAFT_165364 [Guillardia theta CCMP2712]|uniref:Uncharacterized protein n=1 Tax=Guillardia theta (strain CCMP2712) TaxID=905079 RepID=L1IPQ5_GUITC|nr:hypothetical protein GUITHDRAFT_165364 [Guillardia theta CCMP2712]EKX37859.1 hypothetical protein GUITHDRAFT_165364 [Guillardia theta CCMP2712]|eukprot:XP_005824839.1 hypothetical protein GUITHDRAFT_165364 [Guillardia theta CCMP2712]
MKVTEISGDLVYVTRGELETTPAEHAAGTLFSTTKPSALGTTITRRGMVLVSKVASASDPLIQVKDPVLGSSSSGFQAGDYVQMLGEVMLVQSVVSSTSGYLMQNLTVVRGQQSTTAEATADAGTPVTYVFNPKTLTKTIAANTAITSSDLSDMNGIAAGDYLLMTSGTQNEVIKYLGGSSFARGQANTTEGEFPQTGTVIQKVDKMPTLVKFINDTVSTAVNQTTELTDITLKQFEGISAGATVVIDAQVFNVTSIDAANSKLNLVSMYPQTQSVSTTNRLVIPAGTKVYVVQDARLLSQDMAAHDTVVNLYGDVSSTYSAGDFVRVDTYQGTSEILQVTGVSGSSLTVVRGNPTLTHTKNESVLYMYNKVGVFDVSTFVAGDYIKVGQELDQVQAVGTHELTINRISPYNTWSFHEGSDLLL